MNRFIHVGFYFGGVPKILDLEPTFAALGDWVRYSATTWILWTNKSTEDVFIALRQKIDPADQMFIAYVVIEDCVGIVSPWIWTWIREKVPDGSIVVGQEFEIAMRNKLLPPPTS